MSDLCYNCGDCHLGFHPTPCRRELTECMVCRNLGHQYTFCPKSVRNIEKNYEYCMLCHNCDEWHLPTPCEHDLVQCNRCFNHGHLPHFCPRYPIVRGSDVANGFYAISINQVHPELFRKIKVDTCVETLRLLEKYTKQQVFNYMSRPALPPLQTVVTPVLPTGHVLPPPGQFQHASGHAHTSQDNPAPVVSYEDQFDRQDSQQIVNPQDPATSPHVPPTTNSAGGQLMRSPKGSSDHSDYQVMHEKFGHGELAETQGVQDAAGDRIDGTAVPSKTKKTKTKVAKSKPKGEKRTRRPPQPRCADCKKRHKRCEHDVEARNTGDTPGASQSPQPTQIPDAVVAADEDCENKTGTPNETNEQANSIVRFPLPQWNAGVQTDFNAQTIPDEPITMEQGEALRLATAAMPPVFHKMSTRIGQQQYQGNLEQMDWLARSAEHAMSGQQGLAALASAAETQSSNNMIPFNVNNEKHIQFPGFRPDHHVLRSNGYGFSHTNQSVEMQQAQEAQTEVPSGVASIDQMLAQDRGHAPADHQRVIAPNHHNMEDTVFTFDGNGNGNGNVITSVEEPAAEATPRRRRDPG